MKRDDWENLLDKTPRDCVLRLQFSDWLEENGFLEESSYQRWMSKNQAFPVFVENLGMWCWGNGGVLRDYPRGGSFDWQAIIPEVFWKYLVGHPQINTIYWKYWQTRVAAEESLLKTLLHLGILP